MKCMRDKKMLVGRVVALVAALLLTCAVFPRVARADEGSVRIHVLNFYEDEDAILIESDGRFGMVDSGEDLNISVEAIQQKPPYDKNGERLATLIFILFEVERTQLMDALDEVLKLDVTKSIDNVIRVEE